MDKRASVADSQDRADGELPPQTLSHSDGQSRSAWPGGTPPAAEIDGLLSHLQIRLDVRICDPSLIQRALTHRSFSNEHPEMAVLDNERLEFLGDAILDFLAGTHLFEHYPEMQEGELTRIRAALVRTETLAEFAHELGLGEYVLLGRGEEASGGRMRPAILCDAFEALIGALYLDQGLKTTRRLFEFLVGGRIEQILREDAGRDPKSELQELTQMLYRITPTYVTVEERGPDHAKEFTVEVWIGDHPYGRGSESSKHKATREAARAALANLPFANSSEFGRASRGRKERNDPRD